MRTKASISISGSGQVLLPGGLALKATKCEFHYLPRAKRSPELFGWVQLNVPFVVVEKFFRESKAGLRKTDTCRVSIERGHGEPTELTVVFVTDRIRRDAAEEARLIAENVHVIKGPWW